MSVSKPTESQAGVLSGGFCQQHKCGNAANPFSPDPPAPPFGEDAQLRLVLGCWCWLWFVVDTQRDKRANMGAGEGKKARKCWAPHALGGPPFGAPLFLGWPKRDWPSVFFQPSVTTQREGNRGQEPVSNWRRHSKLWGRRHNSHPRGVEDNSPTNSAFFNATQGCSQTRVGRVDTVECRS